MDNFNLREYLVENKLLKENIDTAFIFSHEDYHDLYLGDKTELENDDNPEGKVNLEYSTDLDPGMIQMIYWDNDGPSSDTFNSKLEYVIGAISNFWGEDQFIEQYGFEDEIDAAGDDWGKVFDKHVEDNLDMYYDELNQRADKSYPDGDSGKGVVILVNGKQVAGPKANIYKTSPD